MSNRVCPWWLGPVLASRVRRWLGQDPLEILSPFVREGMAVLEPGPGMGFFTIPLAQLVGTSGRVIAVDLQQKMIDGLKKRAASANVLNRIECRVCSSDSLGLNELAGTVDFALAFAMVHELPDAERFFAEIARALKPQGYLLLAEPRGHIDELKFGAELKSAAGFNLRVQEKPEISRSHAALLIKC